MKRDTLEGIEPLLKVLRAHPALRETKLATFNLDGRDFLHFHDEPEGVFADVRLSGGFVRMPVSTSSEQSELIDRIDRKLSSLDSHGRDRKRLNRKPRGS